jgi:hypothetical protein
MQQATAWHKEQTQRVRAYQPKRQELPGNWRVPGGCTDCVPPPPPKSQAKLTVPTELFAVQEQGKGQTRAAIISATLAAIGIALFIRLL